MPQCSLNGNSKNSVTSVLEATGNSGFQVENNMWMFQENNFCVSLDLTVMKEGDELH